MKKSAIPHDLFENITRNITDCETLNHWRRADKDFRDWSNTYGYDRLTRIWGI